MADATFIYMAVFLTFCAIGNIWFLHVSYKRIKKRKATKQVATSAEPDSDTQLEATQQRELELFEHSLFMMAVMDFPWVMLCAIQCWINGLTETNAWHQASGNDSFGCVLMGFYSTFSLISMTASNIAVAYYHPRNKSRRHLDTNGSSVLKLFMLGILPAALFFACIPLMSTGFALTNGGFCYADWTVPVQATFLFLASTLALGVGAFRWLQVIKTTPSESKEKGHAVLALVVFCSVWAMWPIAAIYGLVHASIPPAPYMIIGGTLGHMQAMLNPLLYGHWMYGDVQVSTRAGQKEDLLTVHTAEFHA